MRRAPSARTDAKPLSRNTRSCCDTGLGDAEFAVHDGHDVARTVLAGGEQFENALPHRIAENVEGVHRWLRSSLRLTAQNAVVRAAAARAAASTVPALIEASPLCSLRCGIWSLLVRRGHRSSLIYKYVPCPVRQC
jgi:hypothetical protein